MIEKENTSLPFAQKRWVSLKSCFTHYKIFLFQNQVIAFI